MGERIHSVNSNASCGRGSWVTSCTLHKPAGTSRSEIRCEVRSRTLAKRVHREFRGTRASVGLVCRCRTQVTIEPIYKRSDVFLGFPKIGPTMHFSRTHYNFDRWCLDP